MPHHGQGAAPAELAAVEAADRPVDGVLVGTQDAEPGPGVLGLVDGPLLVRLLEEAALGDHPQRLGERGGLPAAHLSHPPCSTCWTGTGPPGPRRPRRRRAAGRAASA